MFRRADKDLDSAHCRKCRSNFCHHADSPTSTGLCSGCQTKEAEAAETAVTNFIAGRDGLEVVRYLFLETALQAQEQNAAMHVSAMLREQREVNARLAAANLEYVRAERNARRYWDAVEEDMERVIAEDKRQLAAEEETALEPEPNISCPKDKAASQHAFETVQPSSVPNQKLEETVRESERVSIQAPDAVRPEEESDPKPDFPAAWLAAGRREFFRWNASRTRYWTGRQVEVDRRRAVFLTRPPYEASREDRENPGAVLSPQEGEE